MKKVKKISETRAKEILLCVVAECLATPFPTIMRKVDVPNEFCDAAKISAVVLEVPLVFILLLKVKCEMRESNRRTAKHGGAGI